MWEEHPNVFQEVGDVTIRGKEYFQLPAFPGNGIDTTTRDIAAPTDVEICQIVTCISNGNECLVSDAFAGIAEANLCDSVRVDIMIVDNIDNVFVPQLIEIATQSIPEVVYFVYKLIKTCTVQYSTVHGQFPASLPTLWKSIIPTCII
jgi:hypothetical protein